MPTRIFLHLKHIGLHLVRPPWLYLTVFVGTGLILVLTILLPFGMAKSTARTSGAACQTAAQQAHAMAITLDTIGLASGVSLGKSGPVKTFVTNLQATATDFTPTRLAGPAGILPPLGLPSFYPNRYVSTINHTAASQAGLRRATNASLATAKKILVHQGQVYNALSPLLSYDPATDFANFNPTSTDTQKRLALAKSGLTSVKSRLEGLQSQDDPTIASLIARVSQLLSARDRLEHGGTVADWSAAISLAQAAIIINRDTYWSKTAAPLATEISTQAELLDDAAATWRTLSTGHLR